MTVQKFKAFIDAIKEAEDNDPIWCAGYLFLDLTEKQCNALSEILVNKGYATDSKYVYTPIGMGIALPKNDFADWLMNPARRNESAAQMLTHYTK